MPRLLVTGASGFLGRRIMDAAVTRGYTVTGASGPRSEEANSELIRIDISDPISVNKLADQGPYDAVIHAAGIAHRKGSVSDGEYHRTNALGAKNIAELAVRMNIPAFVLISSVLVYGNGTSDNGDISEDDIPAPVDAYGRSKVDAELLASEVCAENTRLVILRPAPIIGENCKGNFRKLMSAIASGRFAWIGDGSNRKSLSYVDDVAYAAIDAALNPAFSGVYNIANGNITMKRTVDLLCDEFESKALPISLPASVARLAVRFSRIFPYAIRSRTASVETWLANTVYSTERLRAAGFRPRTSIEEALRLSAISFRKNSENK